MADQHTPKLGLTKPDVGHSDDTWGAKLNVNFDILDTHLADVDTEISNITQPDPAANDPLPPADTPLIGLSLRYAREDHVHPNAGNSRVPTNSTPPSNPKDGDLWWDSVSGILFIYYEDGTSNQWVVAIPTGGSAGGGGTGDVSGPASSVVDHVTTFTDTSGKWVKDSGVAISALATTTSVTSGLAGKSDVGHTHTSANVTDFAEAVDDRVGSLLTAGTNVTLNYNDAAGTLTINSTASGGGGGDVVGPASAVADNIAVYNAGTGKLIKDGGAAISALATTANLALKAPLASPPLTGTPTAPTAAVGTNTTQVATTAFVQSSLTGRNRVINGRFGVAQTTNPNTVASYVYGTDCWKAMQESGNATVYAVGNTFTSTFNSSGTIQIGTANIKFGLLQIIELANMRDLAGAITTLSASLVVNNAATVTNVKMAILQWTGTADTVTNPISAWGAAGTNPTLAASWAYVTTPANLSVPGTGGNYSVTGTPGVTARNLAVFIWCDSKTAAANDYIALTNVQLESGSAPTAFDVRLYLHELRLCQRYLQLTRVGSGVAFSATQARFSMIHPGMRIAPVPSASGVITITDGYSASPVQSAANVTAFSNNAEMGQYDMANFTGLTSARWHTISAASANVIVLDARL